jgi:hypothetical protein
LLQHERQQRFCDMRRRSTWLIAFQHLAAAEPTAEIAVYFSVPVYWNEKTNCSALAAEPQHFANGRRSAVARRIALRTAHLNAHRRTRYSTQRWSGIEVRLDRFRYWLGVGVILWSHLPVSLCVFFFEYILNDLLWAALRRSRLWDISNGNVARAPTPARLVIVQPFLLRSGGHFRDSKGNSNAFSWVRADFVLTFVFQVEFDERSNMTCWIFHGFPSMRVCSPDLYDFPCFNVIN